MAKLGPEDIQAMVDSIMEEARAANKRLIEKRKIDENARWLKEQLDEMEKEREARAKNEEPWKPSGGSQAEGNKAQDEILAKTFYENLEKSVDCAQVWKPRDRAPGAEPCVENVKLEDWCPPGEYTPDDCDYEDDYEWYDDVPEANGLNFWLGLASGKKGRDLNKELGGYAPQRAAEKKITELVVEAAKLYAEAMAELNLKGVLSWGWESDCVGLKPITTNWCWCPGPYFVFGPPADCDIEQEQFETFAAKLDLPPKCEYKHEHRGFTKCPLWEKNTNGCGDCPLQLT